MASQGETEMGRKHSLEQQEPERRIEDDKQPVNVKMISNELGVGYDASQQTRKERITTRLRRNSSKLLSLLRGRRGSSNVAKSSLEPMSPLTLDQANKGPRPSYPVSTKDTSESPNVMSSPGDVPASQPNTAGEEKHEGVKKESWTRDITIDDQEENKLNKTNVLVDSDLPALLSRKVTTVFANSTVIHRSNRTRPSIQDAGSPEAVEAPIGKNGTGDVDALCHSGSHGKDGHNSSRPNSLSSHSAPHTSDELPPSSQSSIPLNANTGNEVTTQKERRQNGLFRHSQMVSNISPSIVTVEGVANAKVFFETYFNTIFSHVDERSQRHYELEKCLYTLSFSAEDQMEIRKAWVRQENVHLRQYRALKSLCHGSRRGETISVGNYDIVKDLGNGSFGVVHLVRERFGSDVCSTEDMVSAIEKKKMDNARAKAMGSHKSNESVDDRKSSAGMKGVYAMKVIKKSEMLCYSQEGHLRAERDFLVASAQSRWVVPLISSFQDRENLYLVMEYMVGGDFLGLMMRQGVFPENLTRWYIAEMILCIEEAHKLLWIHRDVKPDNFLISASGHLKIGDFGLSFNGHWAHHQAYYNTQRYSMIRKLGLQIEGDIFDRIEQEHAKNSSKRSSKTDSLTNVKDDAPTVGLLRWRNRYQRRKFARSVVGTSQYMAPEVVRESSYDGRCDWWSLGVILYECLYGFTPFEADTRIETKLKILNHHQMLRFPLKRLTDRLVSAEAIDLICQLVQERERRLSARSYRLNDSVLKNLLHFDTRFRDYRGMHVYPNDANEIKFHPFFRGIRWDTHGQSTPPFVPEVRNWADTSYFTDEGHSDKDDRQHSNQANIDKKPEANPPATASPSPADTGPCPCCGQTPQANRASPPGAKTEETAKKKKVKQERARDKILRDDRVGTKAMELRKQGAFLGYTYRRPKPTAFALNSGSRPLSNVYGC